MSTTTETVQDTAVTDRIEQFYREYYEQDIGELAGSYPNDRQTLHVEVADILEFDPALLDDWRNQPTQLQQYAEEALALYDLPVDVDLSGATVTLTDTGGYLERTGVADLSSEHIGEYHAVSGQLARITGRNPRLTAATYACQRCGTTATVLQGRNEITEPTECQGCERQGPFTLESEQSEWVDQRKVKLEEPIEERTQARGQSVAVYVDGELCDYGPGETTLPDHAGEQATILGVVRVDESGLTGRNSSPEAEIWLDAQAIVFDSDAAEDINTEEHRETFERYAERDDAVELVAASLAPSLHAEPESDFATARRACAAWLFNAYRVDPEGGEAKRGDLHMALIGDPGTGKSTLMQYCHDICPKSEFRTGTGLTEVGLTAAAVQEEFAGTTEWTLEPGILPRADGGHCLIDEIDGVIDENTKAIHDALEGEQMVKADKAGIKADLPTRTALLAGGNPTYTRFDPNEAITEQIDLDPALFDRMDLVFTLQDEVDETEDREKAEHTLDAWDELTQAQAGELAEAEATKPTVSKDTLRAWVQYARENIHPQLTPDAKAALADYYVEVRDLNDGHTEEGHQAVPATMRTLEAGIRLSIAFARLRLSETVDIADTENAIKLSKQVVGLGYDPETGQFDEARVNSGMPKSQKNRVDAVMDYVDAKRHEYDGGVPRDEVVERVADQGFDTSKVEQTVETQLEKGVLYRPQTGEVLPA